MEQQIQDLTESYNTKVSAYADIENEINEKNRIIENYNHK